MGDIGDYWREHKEYKERKKRGNIKRFVEYECSCGKKYYSIFDRSRVCDHLKSKPDHKLIRGDVTNYGEEELGL